MHTVMLEDNTTMQLDPAGRCPECGANWNNGDVLARLRALRDSDEYYKNKTDDELIEIAGYYGWTVENPKCFSRLLGVELPYDHPRHYDGVSEWQCPDCTKSWRRFGLPRN